MLLPRRWSPVADTTIQETTAALLRRAAAKLRDPFLCNWDADVKATLSTWLGTAADQYEHEAYDDYDVSGRTVHSVCENSDPCGCITPAAAVARAVLREEPTP